MEKSFVINISEVIAKHADKHEKFESYNKTIVPRRDDGLCRVHVYELPPGKAYCPYHYHTMSEEMFYILQGTGRLTTPEGDRMVSTGDFLFFPANANGAHKLVNSSETEMLVYIDFDTTAPMDISFYPDSGKVGIWGKDTNKLFKLSDAVEYYEGE